MHGQNHIKFLITFCLDVTITYVSYFIKYDKSANLCLDLVRLICTPLVQIILLMFP